MYELFQVDDIGCHCPLMTFGVTYTACKGPELDDLGEPTHTLIPCGCLNRCLQGTSVRVVSPQSELDA